MKAGLFFVLALLSSPAMADEIDDAAAFYHLNADVLRAIGLKESKGNWRAVGHNHNGTEDLCFLQVNSSHLKSLARFGYNRDVLLNDRKACAFAGAWIFAKEIAKAGPSWRAVAHYHTGSASTDHRAKVAYASDVKAYLEILKQEKP